MINRAIVLLLSVLTVLLVSCSKKEVNVAVNNAPLDFTIMYTGVPAESDTKQYVSNPKYEIYWESSDAVAIYNATKGVLNRYVVKSGAGTKIAVFTPDGTAPSYDASDEL